MAKRGVDHNRLLLTWNMMKGGLNPVQAWRDAGKKIARSKAQLNRNKSDAQKVREQTAKFVKDGI